MKRISFHEHWAIFALLLSSTFLFSNNNPAIADLLLYNAEGTTFFEGFVYSSNPAPVVHLNPVHKNTCNSCVMEGNYAKVIEWVNMGFTQYFGWGLVLRRTNVSPYDVLRIGIRGETGNERFEVKMKDANGMEVSLSILGYAKEGITTSYQIVEIPLSEFVAASQNKLDLGIIENISLGFNLNTAGANGKIYIDDIRLATIPDDDSSPKGSK